MTSNQTALKPCPFPHEVTRGVFLEVDTDDFGFVRGACSDCGCVGPFVLIDEDKATEAQRAEAVRLWNTRSDRTAVPEDALDPETLEAIADEIDCFEHSARAHGLRSLAKRQRAALNRETGQ